MFSLLLLPALLSTIIYLFFLWVCRKYWSLNSKIQLLDDTQIPFLSIIIVARNEEQAVKKCVLSIIRNDYPMKGYEIIFVDDYSSDDTLEIVRSLEVENLQILELKDHIRKGAVKAYKKVAHNWATQNAKGDILLFTDADVVVPTSWIRGMASSLLRQNKLMVTGIISLMSENTVCGNFQRFDLAGTMAWTKMGIDTGTTFLANGANMAVRKSAYKKHLSEINFDQESGDDVFLVQAIAKENRADIGFENSPEIMVLTYAESTWAALLNQRLRWAGKTGSYSNKLLSYQIFGIFSFNALLILCLTAGFLHDPRIILVFVLFFTLKTIGEYFLLRHLKKTFNYSISLWKMPLYSFIQMMYIVFIGAATLLGIKYSWKGR